ncbi:MAG: alpha-galactosidase [Lachnospiraceae bacterium]|nr:alpha-galactosidase [Lachnospiraceae bacterium]
MADKEIYSKFELGDMLAVFIKDNRSGNIGYTLLPAGFDEKIELDGWWSVEPAVQCKLVGDNYPDGFIHGHSMKNSQSSNDMKFINQRVEIIEPSSGITKNAVTRITTEYERSGVSINSVLEYENGTDYIKAYSVVVSCSTESRTLEMLSSFNVCAFPAVGKGLRQKDLVLHRMKSKWSMEGKLESRDFLDMELEPAWLRIGAASERFGEVGSMPVRRYFPWMIADDREYGYSIGAQLCINSSWQMEVYNRDEKNSLSGGIADREFGHWTKDLKLGETFVTPVAVLTVGTGDIDEISFRLTSAQNINLINAPESEKELPIIFNEYCTSWGNPDEKEMEAIAERLKGHGIAYCVIDAGWHVKDGNDWSDIGDWITNKNKFPGGLKKTADKIRECGMIPGLWYEMEVVGKDSEMFKNSDMLLKRDGIPIQTMFRRFLDMRKPEVIAYLTERVINNLKENGFGYLKVDYNDNLGIGCDGAESLGEGMRQSLEASRNFFKKIREEIPEIVIENCSSGGHRLEPSMQAVTSMASFSDAHEWKAIPVIAANVTRAILPAQSQIWAVLRSKDDEKRLYYSLSNTFLGRMCLSGDMSTISEEQWRITDEAIAFYKKCAPIIKSGRNFRYGPYQNSYNDLKGWQAVVRAAEDGKSLMAVVNTFEFEKGNDISFELPLTVVTKELKKIKISEAMCWGRSSEESDIDTIDYYMECFARRGITIEIENRTVTISNLSEYDGLVFKLEIAEKTL